LGHERRFCDVRSAHGTHSITSSARRIPAISELRDLARGGAVLSYGPNLFESTRRQVYFVDRILKGAKPADLPVEQATKLELLINLKTAKALGIDVPPALLARADEVIE
jgi:putative ABC transport system substrate-binding protein